MSAKRVNRTSKQLLLYLFVILLLLLSSVNIKNFFTPRKILGAEIEGGVESGKEEFWNELLSKNPNYIPGWIELGRYDRVEEIDPNFIP